MSKELFKYDMYRFSKGNDKLWYCSTYCSSERDCKKCFVCKKGKPDCSYIPRKEFHKIVETKRLKRKALEEIEKL